MSDLCIGNEAMDRPNAPFYSITRVRFDWRTINITTFKQHSTSNSLINDN
jgi:hypothetical protein